MTEKKIKLNKFNLAKALAKELGLKNEMAAPKILKVTLNVGLNASQKDPKIPEVIQSVLSRITGQKPVATLAKKSISNFKIREGMTVGYMVTMRGKRMFDFVQKLVHSVLPRVRDFRGIPVSSVDKRGNLSIGFKEYIAFPEIRSDEVEKLHGLEVNISTNAGSSERGIALFGAIGIPFTKK